MIKAEGGKLELKGNIAEVSAECILVLRELYKISSASPCPRASFS